MQYPVSFLLFLAFLSGSYHKENKPFHEIIDCKEKLMKRADNEPGEGGAYNTGSGAVAETAITENISHQKLQPYLQHTFPTAAIMKPG